MCQAWDRSRHSVVTIAIFLRRSFAGEPETQEAPKPVATVLKNLRLVIMGALS